MSRDLPPILGIIGRKNAGKTELTVTLAGELKRRGHKVMTVKHGHGFHLDHPGRDSWRHRHEGGAARTVVASPTGFGVVGDWPGGEMSLSEIVERFLWDADIVLAEGMKGSPGPKIEVFREGKGTEPLIQGGAAAPRGIIAMVTDRPGTGFSVPTFFTGKEGFLATLADFVEATILRGRGKKRE